MEDSAFDVSEYNLDYEAKVAIRSIAISLKRIADALGAPGNGWSISDLIANTEMNGRQN